MSAENSKLSIKGSKNNLKISSCLGTFIVSAVIGIAVRFIQTAKYIDPETGFSTGGGVLSIILYGVIAIAVLFFCAVSYLSADCKKIIIGNDNHKFACVGARLFAVSLLWDSFYSFFAGIYSAGSSTAGYTGIMKSGTLPLILQSVFALLSAVYFFILASDFSKGTAKAYKRKILATAPVCWAGARLIFRFLRQISFVQVSDLLLELIMIAFMVMFFMAFAQTASGVYSDSFKWRISGFGLSAALIGLILNVPRLVFTFVNSSLINSDHPFTLADMGFAIFVLALIAKIKEDAGRPVSAGYEAKSE